MIVVLNNGFLGLIRQAEKYLYEDVIDIILETTRIVPWVFLLTPSKNLNRTQDDREGDTMSDLNESADELLMEFKEAAYAFGSDVLDEAPGKFAAKFGQKAMFVGPQLEKIKNM